MKKSLDIRRRMLELGKERARKTTRCSNEKAIQVQVQHAYRNWEKKVEKQREQIIKDAKIERKEIHGQMVEVKVLKSLDEV